MSKPTPEPPQNKNFIRDLILTLIIPTLIGKSLIMFSGGRYSEYPGEGWGLVLTFAIIMTVTGLGRFAWKYRNYNDEP